MMKKLAYLLACLCLSCQSSVPEQKKGLPVAKTIKQDSILISKNASKDTPSEITHEIWNVIKQKAKLPFTNEWKVPEQYNPALTCVKMTPQEFELLGLKPRYYEDGTTILPSNFFHSHKILGNFIGLVIVVYAEAYTYNFELLIYDRAGKLMDTQTIASHGGDGGAVWNCRTQFLASTVLQTTYDSSYFSLPNSPNIYHKSIQNITLSLIGKFTKSPLQYVIKRDTSEWLKKARENMERLQEK